MLTTAIRDDAVRSAITATADLLVQTKLFFATSDVVYFHYWPLECFFCAAALSAR